MDDEGRVLDLNDFYYQVVDRGGFTAAGRTLRIPKSTLSHRIQQLETSLGVRLLNRTSRRFAMTDAGEEFYRHAAGMLREAELAETAIRHRLSEPAGTVRCTSAVATMQFALRSIMADFLVRYPRVNVVAHATDENVDIVGENYDVAIRAHTDPLPNSTLVQRTLTPAPWFLFAGAAYLDANEAPQTPKDLKNHPSLFMMRTGVAPVWRLRHSGKAKDEVVMPLTPRLLSDDMTALKQRRSPVSALSRCPATSVATTFAREHCGGCCPPGLPTTPQSRLSFPTGRASCHQSVSSSITLRQSSRKLSRHRSSMGELARRTDQPIFAGWAWPSASRSASIRCGAPGAVLAAGMARLKPTSSFGSLLRPTSLPAQVERAVDQSRVTAARWRLKAIAERVRMASVLKTTGHRPGSCQNGDGRHGENRTDC
jgi:DNA-binding transcriptional LysR family regulator